MNEDNDLRKILQSAFDEPVDRERDLWPHMVERMQRPRVTMPWFEWALAGVGVVMLAFAPTAIPILLYWL